MLLLVPSLCLVVLLLVRGVVAMGRQRICGAPGTGSADERVGARLAQIEAQFGQITAEDVRAETAAECLSLYSLFQPLVLIFAVAPLAGLLGSVTAMMSCTLEVSRTGAVESLAAATEQALVPAMWGLAVSAIAYLGFGLLRLRLYYVEKNLLQPSVERAFQARAGAGRPGRRIASHPEISS